MPVIGRRVIADIVSHPAVRLRSLDDALVDGTAEIAADLLLRGPDAFYVALARRMGIPLVTWDNEQLVRASTVIDVRTPTV